MHGRWVGGEVAGGQDPLMVTLEAWYRQVSCRGRFDVARVPRLFSRTPPTRTFPTLSPGAAATPIYGTIGSVASRAGPCTRRLPAGGDSPGSSYGGFGVG